ncbi:hypothetical protein [Kitasatospora viridis]|uniref:Fe-S cluster biogenesis protein NfuA n=1 Tax=Kitasatospora viridis TaxID=281105 RepID=A0A561SDT6_9ACTN|nr:hypothetical protein [Kitasatospora viridis]TWF73017.1 hypothetical protein FHX73_16168 [Kitasatospora viridis]
MSVEAAGRRVDELLERLSATADPRTRESVEELVRALMALYGEGLTRMVSLLSGRSGAPLEALLGDELAAGLLVLHDLHPEDVHARIGRALAAADATSYEVAGFDPATGGLRLTAGAAQGCGCGSGDAVRARIESALSCFAPEVSAVELGEAPREPVLLQIGARPAAQR